MSFADCGICKDIPDYVSILAASGNLPEASKKLRSIGLHFSQCPSCGACYLLDWDEALSDSRESDEMWLIRLYPAQRELLRLFFETGGDEILNRVAFYLSELKYQLQNSNGKIDPVVLSLLFAIADVDETVRSLAYRSLEEFMAAEAGCARLVLDLMCSYEDDQALWRAKMDKDSQMYRALAERAQALIEAAA